jgi:lysophospholipase L1-like esterase
MNAIYDRPDDRARWRSFLQTYIDVARKGGATPVLITPFPLGALHGDGTVTYQKTADAQWMRDLAAEQKVPLIDLEAASLAFLQDLGPERAAKVYADNGHFSGYGAYEMAKLVAQGIRDQKLDLAGQLTGNLDTNADPAKFPAHLGDDNHTP